MTDQKQKPPGKPELTDDEQAAELSVLNRATTDTNKFAVAVATPLSPATQSALDRLQLRGWVRLIDVDVISETGGQLSRVFMLSPAAVKFRDEQA